MFYKLATMVALCAILATCEDPGFTYNGMLSANLSLDGTAKLTPNGLLALTSIASGKQSKGHAFYPNPINFKDSPMGEAFSFSTTLVFAIVSLYPNLGGHGIAFVISPTQALPGALPSAYLGLLNATSNGRRSNHMVAVELDTVKSGEFDDINDNHVGIDVDDLTSTSSASAGYYDINNQFTPQSLVSGHLMQVWIEYSGLEKRLNVTLAPLPMNKPEKPLLSMHLDISSIIFPTMYVGLSSSTGASATSHYILGWSFRINGTAKSLDHSQLPKLPRTKAEEEQISERLKIGLPLALLVLVFGFVCLAIFLVRRKMKFREVVEEWELDYRTHRFKYKDLYVATNGFKEKELLGSGGFGRVYKGVLPISKLEVAVKRVSHESGQGVREFVAEIVSIGQLRHRNLVALLGYCRRKRELLLVYDYMPNGSLDKYLFDSPKVILNWNQRFRVIKGVASALLYLHQGWEQVVIHRDVKASNVLVDGELNARLGDFGLARLYDHGADPQTTHIVGTLGYLAPEHTRTGRATTSTDVFAFGAFLLEVASGKRPIELQKNAGEEDVVLVEWVFACWERGQIIEASDPRLCGDYDAGEMEMVLKLGLLCSHSEPAGRPSMRRAVQYLEGELPMPELSPGDLSAAAGLIFGAHHEDADEFEVVNYASSSSSWNAVSTEAFVFTDP